MEKRIVMMMDVTPAILKLNLIDRGRLLTLSLKKLSGEPIKSTEITPSVAPLWECFSRKIDEEREKYAGIVEQRRAACNKRWAKSGK